MTNLPGDGGVTGRTWIQKGEESDGRKGAAHWCGVYCFAADAHRKQRETCEADVILTEPEE